MITRAILNARINTALTLAGASQFTVDEIDPEAGGGTRLLLSTRDSGDIGEGLPGRADVDAAYRAVPALTAAFPGGTACLEAVDEWVHIDLLITDDVTPA